MAPRILNLPERSGHLLHVLGTALDVTLAGLWIEAVHPADHATAEALRVAS